LNGRLSVATERAADTIDSNLITEDGVYDGLPILDEDGNPIQP
jgi:hypothetical protein